MEAPEHPYLKRVWQQLRKRNPAHELFLQTVHEIFSSLPAVVDENPEIERLGILERTNLSLHDG
jgi:hypothetical protein